MWRVPIFLLVTSALSLAFLTGCHQSSTGGSTSSPPDGSPGGSSGSAGATGEIDTASGPGGHPSDDASPNPGPTPDNDAAVSSPVDADAPIARDDSGAGGAASLDAPVISAAMLVAGLSPQRFRDNIKTVAGFGDRLQGSTRFDTASAWLDQTLSGLGYTVEHHGYTFQGGARINTFVTKVGSTSPDRMYIVGAHLDGRGNGGGADDDGSGVSLVLEVARAFAPATVQTDVSIRFAFWCNEETGMDGSRAYVTDRAARQGVEDPPGSHKFPEPRWLGMIQHDMMLYDHGLPPGPTQRPGADINIDYQASSKFAAQSKQLADIVATGARTHAKDYPPTVGNNMAGTDCEPFQDVAPAISVREARRVEEILRGSNPNHHQPTDLPESYSDLDYRLGFNALQTTLGTVAALAGARIGP
jgi:hypothetical protein